MRFAITLLAALLTCSFSEQKCTAITIADATQMQWVSGAPGGRSGIKYVVKVRINSCNALQFSNMWIGELNVPITLEFFNTSLDKQIVKGDSVLLVYNHINNESSFNSDTKKLPIDYKGEALIECLVNGKAHYYTVKQFRKLDSLRGE